MIIPPKNFTCGVLVAGRGHWKRLTDSGILKKKNNIPDLLIKTNLCIYMKSVFQEMAKRSTDAVREGRLTVKPEAGEKFIFII